MTIVTHACCEPPEADCCPGATSCRIFETDSPDATQALGYALAQVLQEGDFLALEGELAAGKTCLIKGLALGMGFAGPVTSPTFTLLHIYEGGRLPVYHFDLYRLEKAEELEGIGYDEYFYGEGVCAVEWSGLAQGYLPGRRVQVGLAMPESGDDRESRRRITIACQGGRDLDWQTLERHIQAAG